MTTLALSESSQLSIALFVVGGVIFTLIGLVWKMLNDKIKGLCEANEKTDGKVDAVYDAIEETRHKLRNEHNANLLTETNNRKEADRLIEERFARTVDGLTQQMREQHTETKQAFRDLRADLRLYAGSPRKEES